MMPPIVKYYLISKTAGIQNPEWFCPPSMGWVHPKQETQGNQSGKVYIDMKQIQHSIHQEQSLQYVGSM